MNRVLYYETLTRYRGSGKLESITKILLYRNTVKSTPLDSILGFKHPEYNSEKAYKPRRQKQRERRQEELGEKRRWEFLFRKKDKRICSPMINHLSGPLFPAFILTFRHCLKCA